MTRPPSERLLLDGPAGKIETVIDLPRPSQGVPA